MKCPIGKRKVVLSDPEFPFCSERCRLIDRGNWAGESYKVSIPVPDIEGACSNGGERKTSPIPGGS